MRDICHFEGSSGNNRGIKKGLFFPSDSSWEILPFNYPGQQLNQLQHTEEHLCHFSLESLRDPRQ